MQTLIDRRNFIKKGAFWFAAGLVLPSSELILPRRVGAFDNDNWNIAPVGDSGCSGYKGVALSIGASNGTNANACATKYTHSGGDCDVNYMEIYCRSSGMVATNVKLAIYNDSSGPNAPLAYTAGFSVGSDSWAGAALSGTVSLVDSTVYWLAFKGNDIFAYSYDTGSSGDFHYDTDVTYAGFPANPFGSDGTVDRLVSTRLSYV